MSKYKEKYPWIRLRNLYNGEISDTVDAMDEMPEGWKIAFGDLFLEELDKVIKYYSLEDEFVFEQIKEKYGALRCYCNVTHEEIWDILNKYEALSEHICIECGKPDVPILNLPWILPLCPECFKKGYPKTKSTYEELSSKEKTMPNDITFSGFRHGQKYTRTLDFGNTPNKIRELYRKRINKC